MVNLYFSNQARPGFAILAGWLVIICVALGNDPALAVEQGAQYPGADLAVSERQLNQQITELETAQGVYSRELIDPLLDLARIYTDTERLDKAYESLRRAQHLMHRQDGVHALRQLEVIDLLFELKIKAGDYLEAESQQAFALFISEHNAAEDSPELLPALLKMARWQFETGQYQASRQTQDRARKIIAANFSDTDPRMVEFLILEARTRRMEGTCCAEEALEQARLILEQSPQQNDEYPALLFALADAYTAKRKPELAADIYRQAVSQQARQSGDAATDSEYPPKLIAAYGQLNRFNPHKKIYVPKRNPMDSFPYHHSFLDQQRFEEQLQEEIFIIPFEDHQYDVRFNTDMQKQPDSEPVTRLVGNPIQFELTHLQDILPASYMREDKLAQVSLQLDLTVLADGSVTDLEILSSNAPNKLAQLVKRAVAMSKVRPRLVNGNAVDTQHVQIMQTFSANDDMISSEED